MVDQFTSNLVNNRLLSSSFAISLSAEGKQRGGGGGEGEGQKYLRVPISTLRFRHAHHETKDWLPNLGSRGGRGEEGAIEIVKTFENHEW